MDRLARDVRIALRGFRRTPTFVVSTVLILALGIGMAVAVATVFDAVLRRPLPVRDQDGLVALLLAAVGLYGAMASVVGERTHEFGVRMSLGAAPGQVRRGVLRGALGIAFAGALAGLAGALTGSRLLASLLFGVSPTDPVTLASVCALLVTVALAAADVPARRATRIDPARALRAGD